jgi:predicted dienelactone hydrolase
VRRLAVGLVVVTLALGGTAAAAQTPPVAPGDAGPGEPTYEVGRTTIKITSEPGRTLDADVWYPADEAAVAGVAKSTYTFSGLQYTSTVAYDTPPVSADGPFPLVVYSHGSGGLRWVSAFLTEALAARGFVVIAVDHTGNTAIDTFAGTSLPREEIERLRPVDIRAQIDEMEAASADPSSQFSGAVDADSVGLVGHSAGGTGVLLTASGRGDAPADSRVKAVLALAAFTDPVTDEELAKIDIPVMLISGTLDDVTPIRPQTERPWKELRATPRYRVDLEGGGHESFTDVCLYEDVVAATPDVAPPVAEAVEGFAAEACLPKFLPIAKAHTLIDRYAIGFFARYLQDDKAADKLLAPTQPKIVSLDVER